MYMNMQLLLYQHLVAMEKSIRKGLLWKQELINMQTILLEYKQLCDV